MTRQLTAQRVLGDVDVVARAGLPTQDFLDEALTSISRAVPHASACVATLDPATHLNTGGHKFGELAEIDSRDREWAALEFGSDDPTAMAELARGGATALAIDAWSSASGRESTRLRDFFTPYFGYADELRVVLRDGDEVWGGLSLLRSAEQGTFDADDVALLDRLATPLATGMRAGLVAQLVTGEVHERGPAVLVVDDADQVRSVSDNAAARLAELRSASLTESMGTIASLVGAARRYAAGQTDRPARCRLRGLSGAWLVLHATTLVGSPGEVVITIDEARPPEIVPLVVAAFDLSARERDVALLVLQGADTKEIAARLHVSAWTVQDHLKSIFDKAAVHSRRELMARIWFDQYAPRSGSDLTPSGWFAPS